MNKEELSFTDKVKQEIIEHDGTLEEKKILFYTFIRSAYKVYEGRIVVKSSLKDFLQMVIEQSPEVFPNIKAPEYSYEETTHLGKIIIEDDEGLGKFFSVMGKVDVKDEEQPAYLAGVFLSKGGVNPSTSKFTHLELRCRTHDYMEDIGYAFDKIEMEAMLIEKKGGYYFYIKRQNDIDRLLRLMNAHRSANEFIDIIINRRLDTYFYKSGMADTSSYNSKKTIEKAKEHIAACEHVLENEELKAQFNDKQLTLARVRIEYPESSLILLCETLEDEHAISISKPTASKGLNKFVKVADLEEEH